MGILKLHNHVGPPPKTFPLLGPEPTSRAALENQKRTHELSNGLVVIPVTTAGL